MGRVVKNIIILALGLSLLTSCTKTTPKEFILYDFESESVLDDIHWKCHTLYSLSNLHAVHGKKSLKLEMFSSSYPGLSPFLKYHDWRDYKSFCFEVYNPLSEKIKLTVRIDDKKEALEYSDRYNKSFTIVPGPNSVRIPFNTLKTSNTKRPLELKNIYRFLVFMSHPDKKHVLYLDYFRLLKH